MSRQIWDIVQDRFKKPMSVRVILDDSLPLRGILKCHCGNPLSGAPSRGRHGGYFYYYKCRHSKHNNISVVKSHEQLLQILDQMSFTTVEVRKLKQQLSIGLDRAAAENQKMVEQSEKQLQETEGKLHTLEEKWITDQIEKESYQRWYKIYKEQITALKTTVEMHYAEISSSDKKFLGENLHLLMDLKGKYMRADTMQKREFISQGFTSNLYYQNGTYRTPTVLGVFDDKCLKINNLYSFFL